MRPGHNKRMRGRNNNRKGPNPLTRSYESNGPDVKIRGTAHHVAEKYLQLARDAQSSGDPVMAESYLQHAEHYFRIIAAAQAAQLQAQQGYNRPPGEESDDFDEDDDFSAVPDRFASPAPPERFPQFNAPQPHFGNQPQPFLDRQNYNGNGQDRGGQDRGGQDRGGQDRGGQDRGGQDRGGHDRQQSAERQERFDRGPRQDRPYQDRQNNFRDRNNRDQRQNRNQFEGGRTDRYEPRGNGEQPRAAYAAEPPRAVAPPSPETDETPGLPSFITAPVRAIPAAEPGSEPSELNGAAEDHRFAGEEDEGARFAPRPRRRRRPRLASDDTERGFAASGNDETPAAASPPAHGESAED